MNQVQKFLLEEGVSLKYTGFNYVVMAVQLVMEKEERMRALEKEVYQKVADQYGVSRSSVEKNIRKIRDVLWIDRCGHFLSRVQGGQFHRAPYPGEMIELIALYLKKCSNTNPN